MDKQWMRRQLPEQPPEKLRIWVKNNCRDELGGDMLIFNSERVPIMPGIQEIMEYNDLRPRRWEWAARCTCTACGDDFITQKVKGVHGIRIATGEDGMAYTIEPGENTSGFECVEEAMEGEEIVCPLCNCDVRLVHASKLRGGRTKRIMVMDVENIAGYSTVFYWMFKRTVDEFGMGYIDAEPLYAYVLTECGGLVRYGHIVRNGLFGVCDSCTEWFLMSRNDDSCGMIYRDWGSINGKKQGFYTYDKVPDQEGCTGEKTGITEFITAGGGYAVAYLKYWRNHRNIENLCKAGQAALVAGIVRRAWQYYHSMTAEMEKYIDTSQKKPNRMLGLSKEEFKELRKGGIVLDVNTLDRFNSYKRAGGKLKLRGFMEMQKEFGAPGIGVAISVISMRPGMDLDKLSRYLQKAGVHPGEVRWLLDYWRMARDVYGGRELTQEELWPRNMRDAHDRMRQIQEDRHRMQREAEREALLGQFQEVIDKYGQLQWTDGELCILLPKCPDDLHREGQVLQHCVGAHSKRHIAGSDTIFFVRHYRRPERSYYTLDICMDRGAPREVQLHGYGNEYHGDHKQYRHKIPKKVRDFVDLWEREVLMPWWVQQIKSEKKGKTA